MDDDSYISAVNVRDLAIEQGLALIESELQVTLDAVQRATMIRGLEEVVELWAWHGPSVRH